MRGMCGRGSTNGDQSIVTPLVKGVCLYDGAQHALLLNGAFAHASSGVAGGGTLSYFSATEQRRRCSFSPGLHGMRPGFPFFGHLSSGPPRITTRPPCSPRHPRGPP